MRSGASGLYFDRVGTGGVARPARDAGADVLDDALAGRAARTPSCRPDFAGCRVTIPRGIESLPLKGT